MKRMMFILILGMVTNFVYGQIEIKKVITELQGDGYTYIHKWDESGLITLYNKENVYTDVPVVFKDTGEIPPDYLSEDPIIEDGWSHDKYVEIINNAFTVDQRQQLKGKILRVQTSVDSTTGRLVDVEFTFLETTPLNDFPLSFWRNLELKLKESIYLKPSDYGKRMNYLPLGRMHKFE